MRYQAINAKCSDGEVAIVRDLASTFAYTVFPHMAGAEAEAARLNEEAERVEASPEADDEGNAALLEQLNGMLPESLRAENGEA
jgi:hypothetical protein